ncbi:hypothetical protein [Streptomyces sp. SAI-119]|uniref:hypothetical protein n=1 Tax=Streptomyces sp. SAI-119 TaxID=2940541 RepID=UPI0024751738|nr:hypothetical protein [Streptomyces sp. SAI-119]
MPYNVEVWIDDGVDCFTIYIDRKLVSERGATALQQILRTTVVGWQRVDNDTVLRTLRAVTG